MPAFSIGRKSLLVGVSPLANLIDFAMAQVSIMSMIYVYDAIIAYLFEREEVSVGRLITTCKRIRLCDGAGFAMVRVGFPFLANAFTTTRH